MISCPVMLKINKSESWGSSFDHGVQGRMRSHMAFEAGVSELR